MSHKKCYLVVLSPRLIDKPIPIDAIKHLRQVLNLGLMEAKDMVDSMRPTGRSMLLTDGDRAFLEEGGFIAMGSTSRSIKIFRKIDGNKIKAIKDLRHCTGWGLKQSKNVIDELWNNNRPIDIGAVNEYTVAQLRFHGFEVLGWIGDHFDDSLFEI